MALSDDQRAYRLGKVTGSTVNVLMNESSPAVLSHRWAVDIGLEPADSETWAMRAGSQMESLILDEIERRHGIKITRRGDQVDLPALPNDVCVTLDGFDVEHSTLYESKFLSPHRRRDEFIPAYYAQVLLGMMCTGAERGILTVAQGTSDPVEFEFERNQDSAPYEIEMMRRIAAYLICLKTFTPPYPMPRMVPPEKWRTLDVVREPTNWSGLLLSHLAEYAETAEAAARHDEAGAAARALVPDDVGKVLAGEFQLTRNRKGIVTITRRNAA
ncbi:hypothetical protein [Bradyrhizobium neotropicale]|uniref:hypothetical protein n=1 Tax=Bradyrhizobium neotropicale TaxID=1497615 RepID=UPI001AD75255|nr:hypothetical protein [Bradyrhizobium neotropicale]MBO4221998.1 hypothetical protein [Bradyrhizobium neotropicale]